MIVLSFSLSLIIVLNSFIKFGLSLLAWYNSRTKVSQADFLTFTIEIGAFIPEISPAFVSASVTRSDNCNLGMELLNKLVASSTTGSATSSMTIVSFSSITGLATSSMTIVSFSSIPGSATSSMIIVSFSSITGLATSSMIIVSFSSITGSATSSAIISASSPISPPCIAFAKTLKFT